MNDAALPASETQTPPWPEAVRAWIWGVFALFFVGPAAAWLIMQTPGIDGTDDAVGLVASQPGTGLMLLLAAMLLSIGAGVVGARLVGVRSGLFAAGIVSAWAAWAAGRTDGMMTASDGHGVILLAATGAVVGAALVAGTAWILAVGYERRDPQLGPSDPRPLANLRQAFADPGCWAGIAAGTAVGAVGAWLIAQEPSAGQSFAAATLGALLACGVSRLVTGAMGSDAPLICGFTAVAMLAMLGPLVPLFVTDDVAAAARAGRWPGISSPTPIAWAAGAWIGGPVGSRWFASTAKHAR